MSIQTERVTAPRRASKTGATLVVTVVFAALLLAAAIGVFAIGVGPIDRPATAPGEIDRAAWKVFVLPVAVAALGLLAVAITASRGRAWFATRPGIAALLGTFMLVGLLARLPELPIGVWRDEASTFFDALPDTFAALIAFLRLAELNPPGYYLVMQWWVALAGAEGVVFKLPSLLFGLLLIPACYALGRAAGSALAGLVAAALIAISPEAIYYAQEARPYAMAAVLAALTATFLLRSLSHPGWGAPAGFTLAATALLYTHYTGLMAVGSLAGAGLIVAWRREDSRLALRLFLASAAVALLYAPWAETFLFHLTTGTPWTPEASLASRPVFLLKDLAYTLPWTNGSKWLMGPAALLVLAGIAGGIVALFLRPGTKTGTESGTGTGTRDPRNVGLTRTEAGAVLGMAVLGPAMALAVLAYPPRYMFLFLPMASALFGLWASAARAWWLNRASGTERSGRGPLLPMLLGVVYAWAAIFAWGHAQMTTLPKSGIATIEARTTDADLQSTAFLLAPDFLAPTFGYLFRDRPATFLAFARLESPEIFSAVGYAEIWERPDAIARVQDRIGEIAAAGFDRLAFVQSNCGAPMQDRGRMRYSRVNDLRAWLDATYPRTDETTHPGLNECVLMTTYDLSPPLGAS